MWYPNKRQWLVIWICAALLSSMLLLTVPGLDYPNTSLIHVGAVVLVIGCLLVWQFSDKR